MTQSSANVVEMDRRNNQDRRNAGSDRRTNDDAVATERRQAARRKTPRRRQIDPTTCERDYSDDEIEFMQALDQYKRDNGRMFPTCSEILEVIRGLGYAKIDADVAPAVDLPEPHVDDAIEDFDDIDDLSADVEFDTDSPTA